MPRGRRRSWTDEDLIAAVASCRTLTEIAGKLGVQPCGGTNQVIRKYAYRLGLDLSGFHRHRAWYHALSECGFTDCNNTEVVDGLCRPHYNQQFSKDHLTPLRHRDGGPAMIADDLAWATSMLRHHAPDRLVPSWRPTHPPPPKLVASQDDCPKLVEAQALEPGSLVRVSGRWIRAGGKKLHEMTVAVVEIPSRDQATPPPLPPGTPWVRLTWSEGGRVVVEAERLIEVLWEPATARRRRAS